MAEALDPIAAVADLIAQEIWAELPVPPDALAVMRGYELVRLGYESTAGDRPFVAFEPMAPGNVQNAQIARGCARLLLIEHEMETTEEAITELAWRLCMVPPLRRESVQLLSA